MHPETAIRGRSRLSVPLAALFAVLGAGCTSRSVPAGGGWKSVAASRTLGMAIIEATKDTDLGFAAGRKVTVTSAGFEKDEVGNYLRLLISEEVYKIGGTVDRDGDVNVQLNTHLSGIERLRFFFVPFFETTRLTAEVDAQMVVRDSAGKLVTRQLLKGAARFEETILFSFIPLPGEYFIHQEGKWATVGNAEAFLDDWYATMLESPLIEPTEE